MTNADCPAEGRPADDLVLLAREQFDDAIELLGQTKQKLKRGDVASVKDVGSHIALVLKTLVAVGEARGRLDGLATRRPGDGGGDMDLQAARLEVGRRLDRLRAANDAS